MSVDNLTKADGTGFSGIAKADGTGIDAVTLGTTTAADNYTAEPAPTLIIPFSATNPDDEDNAELYGYGASITAEVSFKHACIKGFIDGITFNTGRESATISETSIISLKINISGGDTTLQLFADNDLLVETDGIENSDPQQIAGWLELY